MINHISINKLVGKGQPRGQHFELIFEGSGICSKKTENSLLNISLDVKQFLKCSSQKSV